MADAVTNKDLNEGLTRIHGRIDALVKEVGKLTADYAATKERVDILKECNAKNESDIQGHDGVINTIEKELDGVCTRVDSHIGTAITSASNWSMKKWAILMLIFGGGVSTATAIIIEAIKLGLGIR
jgi:putative NADH-flavin reductase